MSLLDELREVRQEREQSRAPRCGVGRFLREHEIDAAEFDALYEGNDIADIHALLERKGFTLGHETVKRHSPLRAGDRCSCHSKTS